MPDDTEARPDAGTPEDVYLTAARAMIQAGGDNYADLFEWRNCTDCPSGGPCACAGVPYPSEPVRAAVDAARAPLVAEVARLTFLRDIAVGAKRTAEDVCTLIEAERDEARAEVERLRALTEGGESAVQHGVRYTRDDRTYERWFDDEDDARAEAAISPARRTVVCRRVHIWTGPIETVETVDDAGAMPVDGGTGDGGR